MIQRNGLNEASTIIIFTVARFAALQLCWCRCIDDDNNNANRARSSMMWESDFCPLIYSIETSEIRTCNKHQRLHTLHTYCQLMHRRFRWQHMFANVAVDVDTHRIGHINLLVKWYGTAYVSRNNWCMRSICVASTSKLENHKRKTVYFYFFLLLLLARVVCSMRGRRAWHGMENCLYMAEPTMDDLIFLLFISYDRYAHELTLTSQATPSRAMPCQAKPSQAKPSQAECVYIQLLCIWPEFWILSAWLNQIQFEFAV